jgi:hypothetical protein
MIKKWKFSAYIKDFLEGIEGKFIHEEKFDIIWESLNIFINLLQPHRIDSFESEGTPSEGIEEPVYAKSNIIKGNILRILQYCSYDKNILFNNIFFLTHFYVV